MNIFTGKVVYEDSFEYSGPIAKCGKGGGGSSTVTGDPIYNAGMLALSEEQQAWARELVNVFKRGTGHYGTVGTPAVTEQKWIPSEEKVLKESRKNQGYFLQNGHLYRNTDYGIVNVKSDPSFFEPPTAGHYETVEITPANTSQEWVPDEGVTSELQYMQNIINANQTLLGGQTTVEFEQLGLTQAQIAAQQTLLPGQTELERAQTASASRLIAPTEELTHAQLGSASRLIAPTERLAKATISDTMTGIREKAPVRAKFFQEALEGIDPNEKMRLAQADVAQGFAGAEGTARRGAARMGLNPANIDFGKLATGRAKAIGLARTTARTRAKDESFQRLQSAVSLGRG